jgi:hypothetical protein
MLHVAFPRPRANSNLTIWLPFVAHNHALRDSIYFILHCLMKIVSRVLYDYLVFGHDLVWGHDQVIERLLGAYCRGSGGNVLR